MKRAIALAVFLAALSSIADAQYVPVIPPPPAGNNASAHLLFDAALAISRATLANPAAAQRATFSYAHAIERYNAGDRSAADAAALQAQMEAARPLPAPIAPPVVLPAAPILRTPLISGADVAQIDAEAFLALARGTLQNCGANPPALDAARVLYVKAVREYNAGQFQSVRRDAHDAIDRCAATNAAHP